MIDDVLKQFGLPVDLSKLAGTVDLLWEQRERLTEVIGFVSDNTEQLTKLLELVRDHGDDLVEAVQRVSALLGRAGSGVEAAGSAAQSATRLLAGGLSEAPGADAVLSFAAGSLERGRALVADAGGLLRSVSERLERVPLADEAATAMRSGGARVDELVEQLAEVAQRLGVLGRRLGDVGRAAGGAAPAAAAASFFAPPPPPAEPVVVAPDEAETVPAPKRTTARPKAAAKKQTERKPAAPKKKTAAEKTAPKTAAAAKPAAKKPAAKKTAAKKTVAKKTAAKKTTGTARRD